MPRFKATKTISRKEVIYLDVDSKEDAIKLINENKSSMAVYWSETTSSPEELILEKTTDTECRFIKKEDL